MSSQISILSEAVIKRRIIHCETEYDPDVWDALGTGTCIVFPILVDVALFSMNSFVIVWCSLLAQDLVAGLLRYSNRDRLDIYAALTHEWIKCDLDELQEAYQARIAIRQNQIQN